MRKYKGARSIKSSSRKRSLGKIKVNYNSLVNKEVESFLRVHGAKIKAEDPEIDNTSTTFLKRGPPTLA